jgi:hypothetical protein
MKKTKLFVLGMLAMALVFGVVLTGCPMEDNESSDLFGWSTVSNLPFTRGTLTRPVGIAYGKGMFVAVTTGSESAYSENGSTWTKGDDVTPSGTTICLGFGNGTFVAGLYSGGFAYSTDGKTWTPATGSMGGSNYAKDIIYADNKFIAVGYVSSTYRIATSTDGTTWSASNLPNYTGNSISYGDGTFVAVGLSIAYSSNGTSWTEVPGVSATLGYKALQGTAYGNNTFVAVGTNGKIGYSSDGIDWTLAESPFGSSLISTVVYDGGKFVAVGDDGKIAVSSDGRSWDGYQPFGSKNVASIVFGNGKFVLGGDDGSSPASSRGWMAYSTK